MKLVFKFLFASCVMTSGLLFPAIILAAGARVESMQMPAWVDRAGTRHPLKPGMELNPGDVLSTGDRARVSLIMDDGGMLKMGDNTSVNLVAMLPPVNESGSFETAIHVIKGAIRFSNVTADQNRKRNIDVRIGEITASFRNADIRSSAAIDNDTLCLIEGAVSVQREGDTALAMNDPFGLYMVTKNKPAVSVKQASKTDLAKWIAQTEPLPNEGTLGIDGLWAVNLMSFDSASATARAIQRLTEAGYAADIHNFSYQNRDWYRIRITHFKSEAGARAFADRMDGRFGIHKPWVVKF
ncbi:MAG: hypothetical protein QG652_1157 [Pseudomonadota bacterium]|nr:hypothetical protein [Pseudomonadota bacterium]